jgi:hypothetical protein
MRRAHRLAPIAIPVLCLLAGWLAQASFSPSRPIARRGPTIEPTLPLVVDLRLEGIERRGEGGTARLEVGLVAGSPIEGLRLTLRLPEGVAAHEPPPAALGEPLDLAAGGRRAFVLRLATARDGSFPIRIEATYALPDGRAVHAEQGATLYLGPPVRPGRSHAGAYEVMGVPLEELAR